MRRSGTRTLTAANPAQDLGVTVLSHDDAPTRRMTLRVQVTGVVNAGVQLVVTEVADGVPFQHTIQLFPGAVRPLRFVCAGLAVSAVLTSATGASYVSTSQATVSARLSDDDLPGADAFNWQDCNPLVNVRRGQLYTGAGVLMLGQFLLMTAPAGAVTVDPQLFAATAAPAGGRAPLQLRPGPGLSAVGQAAPWVDERAPGAIAFATGLYVALSTTADVYTDAGATYALRADGKVGTQ